MSELRKKMIKWCHKYLKALLVVIYFANANIAESGIIDSMIGLDPALSCTTALTIVDSFVDTLTTPFYSNIIKENFKMNDPGDDQTEGGPPDPRYTSPTFSYGNPPTRCNQPTPDIHFSYLHGLAIFGFPMGTVEHKTLANGESWTTDGAVRFQAVIIHDRLCIQTMFTYGWQTLGCKPALTEAAAKAINLYHPGTNVVAQTTSDDADISANIGTLINDGAANCTMAPVCSSSYGTTNSQSLIPFTSTIVQCITSSLNGLFNAGCDATVPSMFQVFQNSMRNVVKLVLTLYVIFFAIKIMLGHDLPKKSELFMFVVKFALVLYFSVGVYSSGPTGTTSFQDGVSGFLMPALKGAALSLATTVYEAGQNNLLCAYDIGDYNNSEALYNQLAMWDGIDCRISYYLGITNPMLLGDVLAPAIRAHDAAGGGAAGDAAGAAMGAAEIIGAPFIMLITSMFLAFQVFLAAFSILFCVCVVSIAVYFVNVFLLAMLAMSIVGYFAPIFVPMALFHVTKSYFDAWLKLLISYTLQPTILVAFIALMFTTFDQTMYGSCTFDKQSMGVFGAVFGNPNAKVFIFNASTDPKCTSSPGYILSTIKSGDATTTVDLLLFKYQIIDSYTAYTMFPGMFKMCILGFLFWHFSKLLGAFAADLSGGPNLSAFAVAPTAVAELAAKLAKMYIDSKTGGKGGKAAGGGASVTQ